MMMDGSTWLTNREEASGLPWRKMSQARGKDACGVVRAASFVGPTPLSGRLFTKQTLDLGRGPVSCISVYLISPLSSLLGTDPGPAFKEWCHVGDQGRSKPDSEGGAMLLLSLSIKSRARAPHLSSE